MAQERAPATPKLKPGRGRRRAEDVRRATLEAAAELLLSEGLTRVTFEKVAARAGVSKMTLYKWWPSPGILALQAYFDAVEQVFAFPDTGDIRTDLTTQLRSFIAFMKKHASVIGELVGAAQSDPDLASALAEHYARPRRQIAIDRLRMAQDAGQIRVDIDLITIECQLFGACYHRLLIFHEPLTADFTDGLVANLFESITPRKRRRSG
jgi:AcrR family transcriptional regulator